MDLKHFHYISKSKVEAISGQITPEFHWSKVNPKVQGFGFGIDLNFERMTNTSDTEELVRKTVAIISYFEKKNLTVPVKGVVKIDESAMYRDTNEWFHGLYSLKMDAVGDQQLVTYVLWKAVHNSVFLLFGSPLNVLGSRDVQDGAKYERTSSQILGGMVEGAISNAFIEALHNKQLQTLNENVFLELNPTSHSDIRVNVSSWRQVKRISSKVNVFRGTALAVFCHEALGLLPHRKLDLMFKVHQSMPISRAVIPYDILYLGSPLYTAYA